MKKQNLLSVASGILIIMLLTCWNKHLPWLYFQLLRVVAMIIFSLLAFESNERENKSFAIIFGLSVLIINPFIKVPLGRFNWNILDTIWSVLLIVNIFRMHKK